MSEDGQKMAEVEELLAKAIGELLGVIDCTSSMPREHQLSSLSRMLAIEVDMIVSI